MKPIYISILVIVLAAAAFFGYKVYHRVQLQESLGRAGGGQSEGMSNGESEIPQSGDLCGGTGGIGQIVSVGDNTITLKRKDGKNLITHLTGQTTIKIATGSASKSDLKIGDRVTLVGGPNPNGSFAADTVVVCAATGPQT